MGSEMCIRDSSKPLKGSRHSLLSYIASNFRHPEFCRVLEDDASWMLKNSNTPYGYYSFSIDLHDLCNLVEMDQLPQYVVHQKQVDYSPTSRIKFNINISPVNHLIALTNKVDSATLSEIANIEGDDFFDLTSPDPTS